MIEVTSPGSLGGPQFTITTTSYTYSCGVFDHKFLAHLYWGTPLSSPPDPRGAMRPERLDYMPVEAPRDHQLLDRYWPSAARGYALDTIPQEYGAWGAGEIRDGVFGVRLADGTSATRLVYREYEFLEGPVQPEGMSVLRHPDDSGGSVAGEAGRYRTLRVRLNDPRGDYAVDLFYIAAPEVPALVRWTRFINECDRAITVTNPSSAAIDCDATGRDVVTLAGAWARERHVVRRPIAQGRVETGAKNGASSHQTSPFIAIADAGSDEWNGTVQGIALGYSGGFFARCDGGQFGDARVSVGPGTLEATVGPGKHFDTPAAVMVTSNRGFSGMSEGFHRVMREAVVPARWRERPRQIVINTWEAMYFGVAAEKVVDLAKRGKDIGAELLVLDDGWFSDRRDDTTSLGDWWHNEERFPDGIGAVGDAVRGIGLDFGLWIEPEMVSPESALYREHPEWAIHIPGRESTRARNQLVLDLANPDVVDHVYQSVSRVLAEARPSYVKWDMNRNITEAGSPAVGREHQGEMMHRYILGLYRLMERLTTRFPEVLFEGCAGGGGRFDIGLARFSPRFWTSDQTDAVERLPIQYGTSLVFPPEMMGAHVSSVPNHIVGRDTPAATRVATALPFSFGFELDPAKEPEEDRVVFGRGSELYRRWRDLFRNGRFLRLRGPLNEVDRGVAIGIGGSVRRRGDYAWMSVAADGTEGVVFFYRPLKDGTRSAGSLRIPGLTGTYRVREISLYRDAPNEPIVYEGAFLAEKGLPIPGSSGDYAATVWHLETVDGRI